MDELKLPVGRPQEDTVERIDLTGYMISAKFRRKVITFFKFWDKVVEKKCGGNQHYIHNMENFFGEILDKFEEIPNNKQVELFTAEAPFKMLSELTNLRLPEVFPKKEDSEDFIQIFLSHKFE